MNVPPLPPAPPCSLCNAAPIADWTHGICRGEACHAELLARFRARADRAAAAIVPPHHRAATFDSAELERWVTPSTAIARAKERPEALACVFIGPAGSGKTTLLAARLRMLAVESVTALPRDDDRPVRRVFCDARALVRARLEHQLGAGEAPLVERALDADLLVIDELGAETARGTAENVIAEILHHRHAQELRTLVATPFGRSELEAKYGAGVDRRLFEAAHAHVVRLGKAKAAT